MRYRFLLCQTLLFSLLSFLGSAMVFAATPQTSSQDAAIEKLKDLEVAELLELEVSLDDTFDIFDALVARRTVKVATGRTQTVNRAPSVTTVITAQDIEAMGARDIDEVLEVVPGLHVVHINESYNSSYTLRGIDGDLQLLMMVNGIPFDMLYTGGRNVIWGGMSVNQIARIEVIRGPGSAVYGADAFAGVVNIITKAAEDIDGTEVGMRVGSFDTRDIWLQHGNRWGDVEVALGLEYQTSDGHGATIKKDLQSSIDAQQAAFGIPPASLAPGDLNLQRNNLDLFTDLSWQHWRLRLGYQGHYDTGVGTTFSGYLAPDSSLYEDHRYRADLTYHNPLFLPHWDFTAQLSYIEFQSAPLNNHYLLLPGATMLNPLTGDAVILPEGLILNAGFGERQTHFDVSGAYFGIPKHNIRIGSGYYYGDLYQTTHQTNLDPLTQQILPANALIDLSDTQMVFAPEETRSNWYAFIQDTWALGERWEFTAGVRHDSYSDFGHTTNPRLALVWATSPRLTMKWLYGRAFRAPSFINLYTQNNTVAVGNPDLDPETVDTLEWVIDYYLTQKMHLATNLFTYSWQDRIEVVPGATEDGRRLSLNRGEQLGTGVELEMRWKVTNKLSLLAHYSYLHLNDKFNDRTDNRRSAYLRSDWLIMPKWYLNTQIHYIGSLARQPQDPRETLASYTTVDLTLRRKDVRDPRWNFAVGVRNLFDTEARDPSFIGETGVINFPNDIPRAGRHWFGEVRYRF